MCVCVLVCVCERETSATAEVAASSRMKKSQITVAGAQRSEADPGLLQYHEQLPSLSWHVGEIRGPRSSLLPNSFSHRLETMCTSLAYPQNI